MPRRVDDVVGDEVRHVAGDGEHQVVVLRVHDLHVRAAGLPERGEPGDGGLVGALRRRQHAPAAVEQLGKAGFGARVLRAGDRMARNKVHTLRHGRADVAQHRALDRAHVRQNGAGAQLGRHLRSDGAACPDRHAQNDEIGPARGLRRGGVDGADEAEPQGGVARLLALGVADDGVRQAAPPHGMAERRPDQPEADQRYPLEHRRRHDRPKKLDKAATTLRLSSSVPIVMRRQFGRP
jgi:hypothetical protein